MKEYLPNRRGNCKLRKRHLMSQWNSQEWLPKTAWKWMKFASLELYGCVWVVSLFVPSCHFLHSMQMTVEKWYTPHNGPISVRSQGRLNTKPTHPFNLMRTFVVFLDLGFTVAVVFVAGSLKCYAIKGMHAEDHKIYNWCRYYHHRSRCRLWCLISIPTAFGCVNSFSFSFSSVAPSVVDHQIPTTTVFRQVLFVTVVWQSFFLNLSLLWLLSVDWQHLYHLMHVLLTQHYLMLFSYLIVRVAVLPKQWLNYQR